MKRMKTRLVAEAWVDGRTGANSTGNFWTDGNKLYSYDLLVGDTSESGIKVVRDYTANGRHGFKSQTTSTHVGYSRAYADIVD